uniref:PAS domain-containing protein n=1 Tax=Entomoneis paludosa TaxID=265537 RepID=A0A7S2Y6S5_9STRA|mmetsp:Transcript_20098/g.42064  ORF Transcript_20098/g.42064 Transcript_20098/m.42064 type:complete len:682 (+) Transcript_20098:1619-3664(+)
MKHSTSASQLSTTSSQTGVGANPEHSGDDSIASGTSGGQSSAPMQPTTKFTFPGLWIMTPGCFVPAAQDNLWLVYVRHLDHHDIISSHLENGGSLSQSEKNSGILRSSLRGGSQGSNRSKKIPTLTIDETGTIVDIHIPSSRYKKKKTTFSSDTASGDGSSVASSVPGAVPIDQEWNWVTKDLIGKHISQAHPMPAQGTATVPQDIKASSAESKYPPGVLPPQKPGQSMLDVILENRMDPGHPAVPYSGYPLKTRTYDTAMTTGNAIREENITEAAFEAALDPIFQIDEHGTIQMVNSAATRLFGWKRAEFIGSNISVICGGGHSARHASYMARYLATGETRVIGKNRQLTAQKKDGTEFPIELGVVEVDTFAGDVRLFCGFVRDLTDLKARERLAQEIVEVALDPMFQINQNGIILMVNQATLRTFGYERSELVGHNISMICGGAHGHHHDMYLRNYMRTGEAHVIGKYRELPAKRKDGTEFTIQLAVVEIQQSSSSSSNNNSQTQRLFCGFIHDLSRQKRDNEIMRATIDTSLDPVLHVNENGIIQMVNAATTVHLGFSRQELVGENVSLIVGGAHAAQHGHYMERYLLTGEKRAMGKKRRLTARCKNGQEIPIELGLSEIVTSSTGGERLFCAFLTVLSHRQPTNNDSDSSSKKKNGKEVPSPGPQEQDDDGPMTDEP